MSVRHETYIIYGIKLDPKKITEEAWEKLDSAKLFFPWCERGAKDIYGVLNCPDGNYAIAGKCLAVQDWEGVEDFGCFKAPHMDEYEMHKLSRWLQDNGLADFIVPPWIYDVYVVSHWH
jgi:hypothetical protein